MHSERRAIHDCALYKIRSRRHLAEILLIDFDALKSLAAKGKANYREFSKPSVGDSQPRQIEGPKELLLRVQQRILKLLAQISPPEYLYSGVKRRSAVGNALRHSVLHPLPVSTVKLDITKFYPSSDGRRVYFFFYKTMKCSSEVAQALCDLTTIPASAASNHIHLPTGGATSQLLAYYCYQEMFTALAGLAAKHDTVLGVFVDDIAFSGNGATSRLLNEARIILRRFGLRSKRQKETAWRPNDVKTITGVALTGAGARLLNSRREAIHQLEQSLHNAHIPEDRAILAQRLLGALYSAGQIEICYNERAKALMKQLRADKATWEAIRERSRSHNNRSRLEISHVTRFTRHGEDS